MHASSMLHCSYAPTSTAFKKKLSSLGQKFKSHAQKIEKLSFAHLPHEVPFSDEAVRGSSFVVVGIGGSSLGAKALIQGLGKNNVLFLDNIDPQFVEKKLATLILKKTLFLLISKSGETVEVLSLAKIIGAKLKKKNAALSEHFLVITDDDKSSLAAFAKKNKISMLTSLQSIAGRFSILSVVGLFPAALAGVPWQKVLSGSQKTSWQDAYQLACAQFLHFSQKRNIVVMFPYGEQLNDFSDWYIQLLSESIGKSKKIGITPLKAMGVKDQHSQLQLFLDGPDDKFYIFLKPQRSQTSDSNKLTVPSEKFSLQNLFDAEYQGVIGAFKKKQRPFIEITFPQLTPEIFGELFFFFELEVAFLGELFRINAFNQPAVELSKKITKSILR